MPIACHSRRNRMSRVSQKRRAELSELIEEADTSAANYNCAQPIKSNGGPRQLIYRRLRGAENTFGGAWPASTHFHCWYCKHSFETTPVPIVQQYDSVKDQYDIYGVCCSAACAKAYIIAEKTNDARTRLIWFSKMMMDVFGWPKDKPIQPAWPWQAIDVYGGYMTVAEWRQRNGDPEIRMRLKQPPFVPFHIYTETERRGTAIINERGSDSGQAADEDSVEQQAIQHGAPFSLKGLKRPPEEQCIKTWEQLKAKHPEVAEGEDSEPLFDTFLREHVLPSDEKSKKIREDYVKTQRSRRADRKKYKTAAANIADTNSEPPTPSPVPTVAAKALLATKKKPDAGRRRQAALKPALKQTTGLPERFVSGPASGPAPVSADGLGLEF